MQHVRRTIILVLYVLGVTVITGPALFRYGPYPDLRKAVAESLLTSMHRSLASLFASGSELAELESDRYRSPGRQTSRPLKFRNWHDKRIESFTIRSSRFQGRVLLIHDPTRIKVGFSERLPSAGETTSRIAKREEAAAAINAGGFGDNQGAGTGGKPEGVIVHDGRFVFAQQSAERGRVRIIGFNRRGALVVGTLSKREILNRGIREAVSFGPPLILEGKPLITEGDGGWGIAPRAAIGQRRDGTVILLVIDGRQVTSLGATLRDVQNVMLSYGAYVASNLDGGSSTTMFYDGQVVNRPSDPMGERMVPSVFLVRR